MFLWLMLHLFIEDGKSYAGILFTSLGLQSPGRKKCAIFFVNLLRFNVTIKKAQRQGSRYPAGHHLRTIKLHITVLQVKVGFKQDHKEQLPQPA